MAETKVKFRRGLSALMNLDDAKLLEELPEGRMSDPLEFLQNQIRYEPRQAEAHVIVRIEATVDEMMKDFFGEADRAMEKFYISVRVPVTDERGIPQTVDGEITWQTDELGYVIEDWNRLDGMDIEAAVMTLQRVINRTSDDVVKMMTRTLFAQHIKDDEWFAAYRRVVDGTIKDREANASRETRDSRYYFIFQFWVWKRISDKLERLKATKQDLEYLRVRLLKDDPELRRKYGGRSG